jgi:secondary thiamine-phosphate synthase enzyme
MEFEEGVARRIPHPNLDSWSSTPSTRRVTLRGQEHAIRQQQEQISIHTPGPGAVDITDRVCRFVGDTGIHQGLLTIHVTHTSASLMIQENADPQVLHDMEAFLRRLVPPGDQLFRHTAEGPDDMPAHVRSALTTTTLSIPVNDGQPTLGTWQAIYLYEHRDLGHMRRVVLHVLGD